MVRPSSTASSWVALALGMTMALAACADVLGIDDGVARVEDASLPDVQAEASVDAGLDAEVEAEAAPPPYSPLTCGTGTCNGASQGCCRRGSGPDAAAYAFACDDGGGCDGGLLVTCDRPDNCAKQGAPGAVCCAFGAGVKPATAVRCVSVGACEHPEAGSSAILCNPGDDELCPPDSGLRCLPSLATIVGYPICK